MRSAKQSWIEHSFDEFGSLVLGYTKAIVGDAHQAEDIMQNIFVKLWKVKDFQAIENTKAYILAIARNEAYTHIRKRKKISSLSVVAHCDIFASSDPLRKICIEEALQQLPQEQREIVFLKIYAQLTFQKIADTLEIPLNTAGSRYRYAMEKLSELLGDKKNVS